MICRSCRIWYTHFMNFPRVFSMHVWQPPRSQGLCTGLSAWGNTHLVNEAGAVAQALGFSLMSWEDLPISPEIWPDHFFGPVATMMVNHFLLRPYFPYSIDSHDGLSEWWWVVEWNGMDWDEIVGRSHSSMPRRIPPWHYTSQNCGWWPQVTFTGFWILDLAHPFTDFPIFVQASNIMHQLRMQARFSSVRKLVTVVLSYMLSEPQVWNLQDR